MDRYAKRIRSGSSSSSNVRTGYEIVEIKPRGEVKLDLDDIVSDPGLRKPIDEFDVGIRDEVRREYMARGPCQLIGHMYPRSTFGIHDRSFQEVWYKKFPWLEYSIAKDAAFCFWCYLFKQSDKGGRYAVDAFTKIGFCNWKRALEKFNAHVGAANSCHNNARIQFESFQDQIHNTNMLESFSREMNAICCARSTALLDVTRFLLKQGLPFQGHDESVGLLNRGNFVELLEWYIQRNPDISKVLSPSAPENNQMTTLETQKQFVHACALEVTRAIVNDIGDKVFTLLVDEARDISMKEQMGIVLRYVNKEGCVVERFIGIVRVADTSPHFLKGAIDALFAKHDLSLSKLRGQGYNGVSSMRGEFSGLKSLILQENPYAMYSHCFSCQLQSIVIALGKELYVVREFVSSVSMIVNTTGASCKMRDELRQSEHERLVKQFDGEEGESADTRWGPYYLTLLRLCSMWLSVEQVLENVRDNATCSENRMIAEGLIEKMDKYEFVFVLHLMKYLLGITHELSLVLQQKEKNIIQGVSLISLISTVKYQLQRYREDGWNIILDQVNKFCDLNHIPLIDMDGSVTKPGYKRKGAPLVTNFHYYYVEIFCKVVDLVIQEMNDRFSKASTELLSCIACLDPRNSFSQFNVDQLMHFASLYKKDFSANDYLCLPQQLSNFIANMRHDSQFYEIGNLESLARKMVETGKNSVFPLVYRMIGLALVLPIATASVERAFSAMETIKTGLCNLRDEWMNDSSVVYIENDILSSIEDEQILQRIQSS